ncbi:MAG: TetR/AcrR family transcriptional regulator [Amphritea sp.]
MNQSERKRAAIVDAAINEFREKGFQATSMDALSARAGVSKRTVYNHFANKEALFQEIIQQLFSYSAELTDYTYHPERPLDEQLSAIARQKLELMKTPRFRDLVKVLMAECIHSPELTSMAMEQLSQQEQGLDSWISAAIADNKLKGVEPHYAADQFMALIKSSAFWPQVLMGMPFPDDERCRQIITDSVQMFLSYYRI